jgi:hypothetical protein
MPAYSQNNSGARLRSNGAYALYGSGSGGGGGGGGGSTTLIDSYEDQNLNEYPYPANFEISGARSSVGDYSLYTTSDTTTTYSMPGDGLPYYPTRGDTIKVDINIDYRSGVTYFGFGHADRNNGYAIRLWSERDEFAIIDRRDQTEYVLVETNKYIPSDSWDTVVIDWHSNGINASYRTTTISTGDTSRDSGGFWFRSTTGSCWWDHIRAET